MNSAQKESRALKNFKGVQKISDVKAQVKEKAGIYFLEVMSNGREVRYVPLNLEEDLKVADSWLKVSGDVGQLEANSDALGFPMKISEVSKADSPKKETVNVSNDDKTDQMKKDSQDARTLKAKESIEYAGSQLRVSKAVTYEKGVLVSRNGETWLIEQYKNGQVYNRYLPVNLSKEFMEDGLQIEFDGHVGSPPPNVRLMGSPIHIEHMEKYNGADLRKAEKKSESPTDKGDSKFK